MPPKPGNVDGVTKPSVPTNSSPAVPPEQSADHSTEKAGANSKSKIPEEPKSSHNNQPAPKSQVKTSKEAHGPTATIVITIIIVVLLIGLAYLAYNKSK